MSEEIVALTGSAKKTVEVVESVTASGAEKIVKERVELAGAAEQQTELDACVEACKKIDERTKKGEYDPRRKPTK